MKFSGKKKKKTTKKTPTKKKTSGPWKPKHATDPGPEAADRMGVNLLGLPGGSKTGTALSISRKWPKGGLPVSKPIQFDDVIHVGWDKTPLIGFRHLGVRVPFHFDVRKMMVDNGWNVRKTMEVIMDESAEICARYPIVGFISDTMTSFDFMMTAELRSAGYENIQTYLELKSQLQKYDMNITGLEGTPLHIACFHLTDPPPAIEDKRDPKSKEKRKAKDKIVQGEGGALLTPAASKTIKQHFFGAASLEVLCRSYQSATGKGWKYEIRTEKYDDVRTKNRFRGLLDEKENANLRELVEKIKAGMK